MNEILQKIAKLEGEVGLLQKKYSTIDSRYSTVLMTLEDLTSNATEADKKSASSAIK